MRRYLELYRKASREPEPLGFRGLGFRGLGVGGFRV